MVISSNVIKLQDIVPGVTRIIPPTPQTNSFLFEGI